MILDVHAGFLAGCGGRFHEHGSALRMMVAMERTTRRVREEMMVMVRVMMMGRMVTENNEMMKSMQ